MTARAGPAEPLWEARLAFRLSVALPFLCALLTTFSAFGAMLLTRRLFSEPQSQLSLYLWMLGGPVIAWLLGALLARTITRPLEGILRKGQTILRHAGIAPARIEAANEFGVLSAALDQVLVSFDELIWARDICDNFTDGVLALDGEGKIVGMNRRGQELFGFSFAEAHGRPLTALLPSTDSSGILWSVAQKVLRHEEDRVYHVIPFRLPSGKETELFVTGTSLKYTGNGPGAILVLTE
jgi:PAS domain S-box-containing protein